MGQINFLLSDFLEKKITIKNGFNHVTPNKVAKNTPQHLVLFLRLSSNPLCTSMYRKYWLYAFETGRRVCATYGELRNKVPYVDVQ
jgi:hypothetical protein